jgi:acetyltransferase-like isoleucine patch superfamily enzyme
MTASETAYRAHPTALVDSDQIGTGTRIWAFVHVMAGAVIGRDCNICDYVQVETGARIGDEVVVKTHALVCEHVTLEDRVFIGPNTMFTNDLVPRAKVPPKQWYRTLVREGASLGASVTIIPGITIGRYALIGAGAVVTRDVPDFALMSGNPARQRGSVCRCGTTLSFAGDVAACSCGQGYRMIDGAVTEA